jgi:RNA polymerase sigma-70 factor (ECF subfamily)
LDQVGRLEKTFVRSTRQAHTIQPDEKLLIERCKQGDLSAFDELVRRYEKQVYGFAYRMAGNYDDANDIASEAFVKVFQAIESFRGESNFSTWLFRIVTNLYLDHRKRSKAHVNVPLDEYLDLEESSVARQIEDTSPGPLELVEAGERAQILEAAIQQLPEYQRLMVLLFHTQGKSYEEIAQIMELPIGTVKSRLNRARLALKDKLEPVRELFSE